MAKTHGKFRAKSDVIIEAFQWTGQPPSEWPVWARDSLRIRYEFTNLQIDGNRGTVRANRGDWIIRKSDDDVYPCPNDVFEERWEAVE
jgi:hypothetical protein